jgi:hypothetical protein
MGTYNFLTQVVRRASAITSPSVMIGGLYKHWRYRQNNTLV